MLDGVEPVGNGSESQPSNFSEKSQESSRLLFAQLVSLKSRLLHTFKRPPMAKWLFWSLALVGTTTVSATVGATVALLVPLSQQMFQPQAWSLHDLWRNAFVYRLSRPINILVMGLDRVPDAEEDSPTRMNGRSDTMLLVRIDPKDYSVKMLSIPRDTRVDTPQLSIKKINQANVDGGPALAANIVRGVLNDVEIDRYVRVTTDAFRELVDLVGGVEVFVPQKMQYVDETQRLKIDLEQGWQVLNGEQAEQFARFRNDRKGDIGRVQRQQVLLKALRERLSSPTILPRLPGIVRVMQRYVDTNISLEEMLALANFGLKLDRADIKMVMLPGRFSGPKEYAASYWIMDKAGRDRIMHDYFGINSKDIASDAKPSDNSIRIAIQNASGQPALSDRVAEYLKNLGFRNIYLVKDWPQEERRTQIIVQQGDIKAAENLKSALGLGNIEAASIGDLESDLTLRVGKDWPDSVANY
ncbi:LCP family protein [Aerosakkonema funiforme]|nr:LCP family protein [Aerosakkonema funiforme]